VQVAKLSGLKVIATASLKNHDYIKSLGADYVFDYKDKDVVSKIREVAPDLKYAYDAISEHGSCSLIEQCFGSEGGVICCVLKLSDELLTRKDVSFHTTLVYSMLGEEFNFFWGYYHVSKVDYDYAVQFNIQLEGYLRDGKIKPNIVKKLDGGLADIPAGMDLLRTEGISCGKFVYRI
jgi:NADPH:quinone reductase-like Zn-dependent oxidoreductase